jgi:hypothetical protein
MLEGHAGRSSSTDMTDSRKDQVSAMATSDAATSKSWSVEIFIGEHEGQTRAVARLHTDDRTALVGTGLARLNPSDRDVPEIGDELAAARALSDLAHRLLETAADDIGGLTHTTVSASELG